MSSWLRKLSRRERTHDPEFHKVKTQLTNVATALEGCVQGLETLTRDYDRLYNGVRKFANDFYSYYPTNDQVRRLGESTVTSADRLLEDLKSRALDDPESASIHIIDRQIKAYLQEIRNLQKEFKKVASSRADYESERDRLDRGERRGMDDTRRQSLQDLVDSKRTIYETMLRALTNRLGSTYNKHAQVFQAAWTAYILKLDDGRTLLHKHLHSHTTYAKRLEKDVLRMQLGRLESFNPDI